MILMLPSQSLVLNAYAVLVGQTPGNAALAAHETYIATVGETVYTSALNNIFANYTTTQLASTLLTNLSLTSVFTQAEAEAYLTANASNRVGAMLAVANAVYNYVDDGSGSALNTGVLAAKTTYVAAIEGSYNYSIDTTHITGATLTGSIVSGGQTLTLTTAIDTLSGTSGNDTFIGDAGVLSNADQLTGGDGTDTIKMYGTAGAADLPSMTGIEIAYLSGSTASTNFAAITDLTTVQIDASATGQDYTVGAGVTTLSVANQAAADTVEFTLAATATDANVTVNAFGTSAGDAVLMLDGAALATVNLTGSGTASYVQLKDGTTSVIDTVTKVTIAGDKAVKVDMENGSKFAAVTTVDASANTAGVTAVMETTTGANVTFTGGTGNDVANYGAKFDLNDVVDGGDGTDTLAMTQASVTTVEGYSAANKDTVNTNLSNLEVLMVADALTSNIDASRYDSINSFVFASGINPAATSTISSVTSGVTVNIQDAAGNNTDVLAVEITDATLAGNNSDTVNIVLNDAAALGASDMGVLNAVGVDILNIDTKSLTAAGAAGTTTSYVLDIANTSSALDKVVVTGSVALDISAVALVNSIAEVDAGGMTLAAVTSNGLTAAIAVGGTNGVKITGSMGVDTLTGGDAADIILGGTGVDTIAAGKGNDVITSGAGNDILNFADADSGITSTSFDTITDYTNGTVVGTTDKLVFTTGGSAVGATVAAGWTLNAGMMTKTSATLADFITAASGASATTKEVYAFVSGSDTYAYFTGADGNGSTADDVLIKLTGVTGVSVVTADTATANEIFIG